jgi:hypothetical protein
MPIIAAPLEALAVLGALKNTLKSTGCAEQYNTPGFVLAGIPMYYITQHDSPMPLRSRFRGCHNVFFPDERNSFCAFTAILSSLLSRISGTRTPGFGWQAVATDGGDGIEMTEDR